MNDIIMKRSDKLKKLEQIRIDLYKCNDSNYKKEKYNDYLKTLRKLAYKGDPEAQFYLAQHFEDVTVMGAPNPFYNIKKLFYWYTKAAKQNHPESLNNLANMYEKGEACEQDIKKALDLFEKAANSGIPYMKKNYKLLLTQIKIGKYKI